MIEQLHSPDPALRRAAIIALANAKDAAALPALAALYRSDPDPELRELARRAGRYIQQYAGAAPSAPPPPPAPPPSYSVIAPAAAPASTGSLLELASAAPPAPADAPPVSARDQEIAQRMLDIATAHHINGDKGRAIEHLGKAVSLNPLLRREPFVANLTQALTGMDVAEALPILTHPDRRNALIASTGGLKPRRQGQPPRTGVESATWDNVSIDLALYWLVATLGLVAIFVFAIDALEKLYNDMPATTAQQMDFEALFAASMTGLILVSVFYGIIAAISLVIQSGAIHVAARYLLGGDGTFVYLLRRYVPFQTMVMLGMAAAFVAVLLLGSQAEIWYLAPLLMMGASIGVWYYTIRLVADVYAFGWWSGCGAILLGSLLLGVVSFGGNLLLASVVSALLGTGS